ncbi:unnamed protein product [Absidia cylindrospora]
MEVLLLDPQINNLSTHGLHGSSSETSSDVNTDADSEESGVEQDDDVGSVACYKYSYDSMKNSSPFKAPVVRGDQVLSAVFDTGASVSLITADLVERFGLVPNGDKITLTGFDGRSKVVCDIVMDVPVQVGGKIRLEHMCVQTSKTNFCLLGMTCFKNYGIKQDLKNGIIMVPTLGGRSYVEVKGVFTTDTNGTTLGVMVNQVDGEVVDEAVDDLDLTGIDDGELRALMVRNKDRFVEVSGHGLVSNAVHDIDLKAGSKPIRSRPYRLTWEEDAHLKEELRSLLDLGLI